MITTPTNLSRPEAKDPRGKSLEGKVIALSISDSPDLERLGFGRTHLTDAMVEIARYLLARGATLAYGGDLRPGGFVEVLMRLIEGYQNESADLSAPAPPSAKVSGPRARNYLAWPLSLPSGTGAENAYRGLVELRPLPLARELASAFGADPAAFVTPDTAPNRLLWACSLTAMRQRMTAQIDARIVLGGAVAGFKGSYPGIVEEVVLAMDARKPVYLLGAFGGAARATIEALRGNTVAVLTRRYQEEQTPGEAAFTNHVNEVTRDHPDLVAPIDYDALVARLRNHGVAGLMNGLSDEQNEQLFAAKDIRDMVCLLLRGLEKALDLS